MKKIALTLVALALPLLIGCKTSPETTVAPASAKHSGPASTVTAGLPENTRGHK